MRSAPLLFVAALLAGGCSPQPRGRTCSHAQQASSATPKFLNNAPLPCRGTLYGEVNIRYSPEDLVFPRHDGTIWKPERFTDTYFRFARKIGVKVHFHDLRHTHASQLLRAGVPVKAVSESLGHSAVGITLDTYSHVLPGMHEEAAQKIDAALRAAMEPPRLV